MLSEAGNLNDGLGVKYYSDRKHAGGFKDKLENGIGITEWQSGAKVYGVFKDGKLVGRILQDRTGAKFWHIYTNTKPPRPLGGLFDTRKQATSWALKNKKWDIK